MGIDFLVCNECETGFPDVNDYKFCECGRDWCDEECAEKGGLRQVLDEDGYYSGESDCKFCRGEKFDDDVLLNFILKREGISKEDLISLYKKESK